MPIEPQGRSVLRWPLGGSVPHTRVPCGNPGESSRTVPAKSSPVPAGGRCCPGISLIAPARTNRSCGLTLDAPTSTSTSPGRRAGTETSFVPLADRAVLSSAVDGRRPRSGDGRRARQRRYVVSLLSDRQWVRAACEPSARGRRAAVRCLVHRRGPAAQGQRGVIAGSRRDPERASSRLAELVLRSFARPGTNATS